MRIHTNTRSAVAALACVQLVAAGRLAAQRTDDVRSLGVARLAAQVGSGVLLAPPGYVAGGLATRALARTFGASDEAASRAAQHGAYAGLVLTSSAGPALIGARGPGHGSYPAAIGGALVGGLASALVVRLNRPAGDRPCRFVCALSTVAVVALPSVGATVGYNISRRR